MKWNDHGYGVGGMSYRYHHNLTDPTIKPYGTTAPGYSLTKFHILGEQNLPGPYRPTRRYDIPVDDSFWWLFDVATETWNELVTLSKQYDITPATRVKMSPKVSGLSCYESFKGIKGCAPLAKEIRHFVWCEFHKRFRKVDASYHPKGKSNRPNRFGTRLRYKNATRFKSIPVPNAQWAEEYIRHAGFDPKDVEFMRLYRQHDKYFIRAAIKRPVQPDWAARPKIIGGVSFSDSGMHVAIKHKDGKLLESFRIPWRQLKRNWRTNRKVWKILRAVTGTWFYDDRTMQKSIRPEYKALVRRVVKVGLVEFAAGAVRLKRAPGWDNLPEGGAKTGRKRVVIRRFLHCPTCHRVIVFSKIDLARFKAGNLVTPCCQTRLDYGLTLAQRACDLGYARAGHNRLSLAVEPLVSARKLAMPMSLPKTSDAKRAQAKSKKKKSTNTNYINSGRGSFVSPYPGLSAPLDHQATGICKCPQRNLLVDLEVRGLMMSVVSEEVGRAINELRAGDQNLAMQTLVNLQTYLALADDQALEVAAPKEDTSKHLRLQGDSTEGRTDQGEVQPCDGVGKSAITERWADKHNLKGDMHFLSALPTAAQRLEWVRSHQEQFECFDWDEYAAVFQGILVKTDLDDLPGSVKDARLKESRSNPERRALFTRVLKHKHRHVQALLDELLANEMLVDEDEMQRIEDFMRAEDEAEKKRLLEVEVKRRRLQYEADLMLYTSVYGTKEAAERYIREVALREAEGDFSDEMIHGNSPELELFESENPWRPAYEKYQDIIRAQEACFYSANRKNVSPSFGEFMPDLIQAALKFSPSIRL